MGEVFEAEHEAIGRRAAIKVLHARYAQDKELVTRFFNEARATNLVGHPGLVQIYDFGQQPDGSAYLVMELLQGETLGARLRRLGMLTVASTVRLGQQVADALAAAHQKGIIHRDLKPDNLMLVEDAVAPSGERVKLLDFGIAKLSGTELGNRLTQSLVVMGTPRYMAPEQCRSASSAYAPADVYALGVMLFEALAGRAPFESESSADLLAMQLRDPPPEISALVPSIPGELARLIMRMLAKNPQLRPKMREVASSLLLLAEPSMMRDEQNALTIPPTERHYIESPSSRSTLGRASGESRHVRTQQQRILPWVAGASLLLLVGAVWRFLDTESASQSTAAQPPVRTPIQKTQTAESHTGPGELTTMETAAPAQMTGLPPQRSVLDLAAPTAAPQMAVSQSTDALVRTLPPKMPESPLIRKHEDTKTKPRQRPNAVSAEPQIPLPILKEPVEDIPLPAHLRPARQGR